MSLFLYAFSAMMIVVGSCLILYTRQSRSFVRQLFNQLPHRALAAVPVALGIGLLVSSPRSVHGWFVILLGLLAILKGVLLFLNPQNAVPMIQQWYTETASDQTHRLFGIISVVLGTAVFSWIL